MRLPASAYSSACWSWVDRRHGSWLGVTSLVKSARRDFESMFHREYVRVVSSRGEQARIGDHWVRGWPCVASHGECHGILHRGAREHVGHGDDPHPTFLGTTGEELAVWAERDAEVVGEAEHGRMQTSDLSLGAEIEQQYFGHLGMIAISVPTWESVEGMNEALQAPYFRSRIGLAVLVSHTWKCQPGELDARRVFRATKVVSGLTASGALGLSNSQTTSRSGSRRSVDRPSPSSTATTVGSELVRASSLLMSMVSSASVPCRGRDVSKWPARVSMSSKAGGLRVVTASRRSLLSGQKL